MKVAAAAAAAVVCRTVTTALVDQMQMPFAVTVRSASDALVAEPFPSHPGTTATPISSPFQLALLAPHHLPTAWQSTHKLSMDFSN
jgi:hypothetical protein